MKGLVYRQDGEVIVNARQNIISDMDTIPPYDYSVFEDQIFFRSYNGKVVRAVDYELSRGCPYTCSYCVETIIQAYYGFNEITSHGVVRNARKYLRNKSGKRIFSEMQSLHEHQGVTFFRPCFFGASLPLQWG